MSRYAIEAYIMLYLDNIDWKNKSGHKGLKLRSSRKAVPLYFGRNVTLSGVFWWST